MGNGNMGAMVWGNENLFVTVNRADFWDHRGGELIMEGNNYRRLVAAIDPNDGAAVDNAYIVQEFPENVWKPQRLPVGRFEFIPKAGVKLLQAELVYKSGEIIISTNTDHKIKLSHGIKENVLHIGDSGKIIEKVILKPSWDFEKSREFLSRFAFKAPEIINQNGLTGWIQPCPEDPSLASVCKDVENGFIIALALGKDNGAALKNVVCSIERVSGLLQEFIEDNAAWWRKYWQGTPEINFPDDFYNSFFKYALYKFAAATNPSSPLPSALQGPWHEEYQNAQWSGDYHFNINIQQIYTIAFGAGKLEHLMPLFNMVESKSFMDNMRHNAHAMFGINDGQLLTHAVDDRGFQCGWIGTGSTLDQACGGWLAQLYWLYYKYSLDEEFLLERAYPFMTAILRVYEEMLEEHDGKFSIPLAISAEYGCRNPNGQRAGKDPSYQFACIHMLLNALLEASKILKIQPKPKWLEMKEKVPPYTLIEEEGQYSKNKRIAIWENQDLEYCHRHHSHLACIYPFDTLGDINSPEKDEIVNNSIDQWVLKGMGEWSEWCIPWAAIIHTRLGFHESPAILLNIWRELFINEGMSTVYLPRLRGLTVHRRNDMLKPKESNEVMQLDGTMSGATAMMEMLAHTHSGITNVFHGVPDKWKNVSFKNILLPGPLSISASRKNGKINEMCVESFGGRIVTLNIHGIDSMKITRDGKSETVEMPCTLNIEKGKKIFLAE
jgi:hypothetical protein